MLTNDVKIRIYNHTVKTIEQAKTKGRKSITVNVFSLYCNETKTLSEADLIELNDFIMSELIKLGYTVTEDNDRAKWKVKGL